MMTKKDKKPKPKKVAPVKKKKTAARTRNVRPPPRETDVITEIQSLTGDIENLADEMREWQGNIEEKFSATQKYEDVSSCVDALENIQTEFDHDCLAVYTFQIQDPRPSRKQSRSSRRSDICDVISQVIDRLTHATDIKPEHEEDVAAYVDELENMQNELEGVEFPGMF